MKNPLMLLMAASLSLSLAGCSREAPSPDSMASPPDAAPATPPGDDPYAIFNTTHTVRDIMNSVIIPNAELLWNAVRYVATEEGVEETFPRTEADWRALRAGAIALIEGGNALMIPGRDVDDEPPGEDYPDYQYPPGEIASLIEADRETWNSYLREMQAYVYETLDAIERRDPLRLTDDGARINQACQGCHARFWYRPQN